MCCGTSDRWLCAVVLVIGGCVLCAVVLVIGGCVVWF